MSDRSDSPSPQVDRANPLTPGKSEDEHMSQDPESPGRMEAENNYHPDTGLSTPDPPAVEFTFPTKDDPIWKKVTKNHLFPYGKAAGYTPPNIEEFASFQANNGLWEKVVIPLDRLLENVHPRQKEELESNPSDYVIIAPFNGGRRLFELDGNTADKITAMLRPVADLHGGIHIIPAVPGNSGPATRIGKYTAPTILIASCNQTLRNILLSQQTFITYDYAFHVVRPDATVYSWSVGIFLTTVPDDLATGPPINRLLWIIKSTLWTHPKYRWEVDRATRALDGDLNRRVFDATASIRFFPIPAEDDAPRSRLWLLTMAPPVHLMPHKEFEAIKAVIRSIEFSEQVFSIKAHPRHVRNEPVLCVVCKADTHFSFDCHFAKDDGDYIGPRKQLKDLERDGSIPVQQRQPIRRGRGRGGRRGSGSGRSQRN